jgi:hypothetical protein
MKDDYTPVVIIVLCSILIIGVMMVLGSEISEPGNITKGRNDGIVFCSEKPDECKIEYSYLKLKETQK